MDTFMRDEQNVRPSAGTLARLSVFLTSEIGTEKHFYGLGYGKIEHRQLCSSGD
jgi:hypothetical protein